MVTRTLRRLAEMNNEMALWDSPNGIQIPASAGLVDIITFNKCLGPSEVSKVTKAYKGELFDMAAEYVWARTMNVLRGRVLQLGEEFVLEMLGKENMDTYDITEVDVINLASDLGFINKKAKLDFMHNVDIIHYYTSRQAKDDNEEMHMIDSAKIIKNSFQYVLGLEETDFNFSFNDFRKKLMLESLSDGTSLFQTLLDSPYFYKRTTVNTLLNLSRKTEGGELDHVLSNMTVIIPGIWESLLSDDRWPIGTAYAEEVNKGNKKLVGALKTVLMKVQGFDYVPENLRSNTFLEYAKKLIEAHQSFDNFYKEPSAAKALASLGTIPTPAIGVCVSAALSSKLGNYYGIAYDAQPHVDRILSRISAERWEYYFNKVLPGDERILLKIINGGEPLDNWITFVNEELPDDLNIIDKNIERLITEATSGNVQRIASRAKNIYQNLR
jgi:hypothetical protein